MKLREMLENCFSNKPDQIAWRMATGDGGYEVVDFPEYMTKFIPNGVVYLTDCEIKDWSWDVRNCRLYVDLYEQGKPSPVVEDKQEDPEEEDDNDKGDWVIKAKLSEETGSTTWTKTYKNTAFNRVYGYYNKMIDQLNNGCAFVRFPDNQRASFDNKQDIAMASSQIMFIIIERAKK